MEIDFEWMAWTLPTAVFFITIALMLVGMTVWELVSPTVPRRGLLPLVTSRGDRFFIGLLGSAYIMLAWIGLTDLSLWIALGLSVVFLALILKFG